MQDYKLVDTREVMGVKKGIYKMPGSQKQYCKCNGTMMDIASFRKLKKAKLVGKKAKNPVKVRRGGEYDEADDDSDYNNEEGMENDFQPHITGGRKNTKKGGQAESDSDYDSEMNNMDNDSFPTVGGKKNSKKGGEVHDLPPIILGGKKNSKKGGEADDIQFLGGKKNSKKGGEADDIQFLGGKKNSKKGGEADDIQFLGGKKMSKKGGEADDIQFLGGKKMSKKGGVADFHTPRIGFDDIPIFTESLNNTFGKLFGGKNSKKGGENCNTGIKGGNTDEHGMMGGKKLRRGGGNDIVMEGGRKSNRSGGSEYEDVL